MPGVYKLVQIEDRPVIKLSSEKITNPGIKQIYRLIDASGTYREDLLALEEEGVEKYLKADSYDGLSAVSLLRQAVTQGRRILTRENITKTQRYVAECVAKMPLYALKIVEPSPYVSKPSQGLKELIDALKCKYEKS